MKNQSKDLKTRVASVTGKIAAGASAFGASAMAFAVDHSAAINAAGADATTNSTTAVTAVVGLAAVVMGVGIVLRLMNR